MNRFSFFSLNVVKHDVDKKKYNFAGCKFLGARDRVRCDIISISGLTRDVMALLWATVTRAMATEISDK
jgi:hypothetical protein